MMWSGVESQQAATAGQGGRYACTALMQIY
jgi:hypothetical protein